MELAEKYILGVVSGEIIVNQHVKNAVKRHLNDLEKSSKDDFEYYFDKKIATVYCKAIRLIPHTSGSVAGKPFQLEGWQAFFVWCLYGWRKKSDNYMRFRKAYVEVPRKNGKTEFLAALGTLDIILNNIKGVEYYWAATTEKQAKIGWSRQEVMIEETSKYSEFVKNRFKIYTSKSRIVDKKHRAFVSVVASDSKKQDGHLVYRGFIDEYHAHPDNSVVSILETGMGAFESPLLVIITTAGFNKQSVCKSLSDKYARVVAGELENDNVLALIFGLDEDDDWKDERSWYKANPSLGNALKLSFMKSQFANVLTEGAATELAFKVKNLNIWTNAEITWISTEKWKASNKAVKITEADLIGRKCIIGLDLSSVDDITAAAFVFPLDNEEFAIKMMFWIPEDTALMRAKKDGVKYLEWIENGYINTTPGSSIDYEFVWRDLEKEMKQYDVELINTDPWNSYHIERIAKDAGFTEMYEVSQRIASLCFPTKELERMILRERIKHFNNPVLGWMMNNVLLRFDSNGNYVIDKKKSQDKIDGVAAVIDAFAGIFSEKEEDNNTLPDGWELTFA